MHSSRHLYKQNSNFYAINWLKGRKYSWHYTWQWQGSMMRNYSSRCSLEIIVSKNFNLIGTLFSLRRIFSKGFKDSQHQWKGVSSTILLWNTLWQTTLGLWWKRFLMEGCLLLIKLLSFCWKINNLSCWLDWYQFQKV